MCHCACTLQSFFVRNTPCNGRATGGHSISRSHFHNCNTDALMYSSPVLHYLIPALVCLIMQPVNALANHFVCLIATTQAVPSHQHSWDSYLNPQNLVSKVHGPAGQVHSAQKHAPWPKRANSRRIPGLCYKLQITLQEPHLTWSLTVRLRSHAPQVRHMSYPVGSQTTLQEPRLTWSLNVRLRSHAPQVRQQQLQEEVGLLGVGDPQDGAAVARGLVVAGRREPGRNQPSEAHEHPRNTCMQQNPADMPDFRCAQLAAGA